LDLSANLGIAQQYEHREFIEAMDRVAAACKHHEKAAGILAPNLDYLPLWIEKGFTFLVVGSDGGCVAKGLQDIYSTCNTWQRKLDNS
jgi:2-keto-3-deoxy-L-rhamnonate aldolase RhmA